MEQDNVDKNKSKTNNDTQSDVLQSENKSSSQNSNINKPKWLPAYLLASIVSIIAGLFFLIAVFEFNDLYPGQDGVFAFIGIYIFLTPLFIFVGILITRIIQLRKITKNIKLMLILIIFIFIAVVVGERLVSNNSDENQISKVNKSLYQMKQVCKAYDQYTLSKISSSNNNINISCIDEKGFSQSHLTACKNVRLSYELLKNRPEAPGKTIVGFGGKYPYNIEMFCYSNTSYILDE